MVGRIVSGRRPRGRRLLAVLAVLLLVVPTIEIAVIVAIGRTIGGWPTLALLLAESALGAWLVRREGTRAWAALADALRTGRMPAGELGDAALVLVGGTLLLTPGFVTDVAGFFCVLPMTRHLARRVLTRAIERRMHSSWLSVVRAGHPKSTGPVVPGTVVDSEQPESNGPHGPAN